MKNLYLFNAHVSFQRAKKVLLTTLLALFAFTVHAQVGIGTISPDASAQLDIQSTNRGLLIPRILESIRTTMPTANGLLVYQIDGTAPGFYYFDGAAWQPLKSTGSSGGGAIIPFASGTPIIMTTLLGGLVGTGSAIGFGASLTGLVASLPLLDGSLLTGNMAFSVPRAGTITSISGMFSSTVAINSILSTYNIKAQLFSAAAGVNIFLPVIGGEVTLPALPGIIAVGSITQATVSGLNIPVNAGDRLMLVFSCAEIGGVIGTVLTGHASAGVSIN